MCDYSLMGRRSRLAETGDQLTLFSFPTGSRGFVSASDAQKFKSLVSNTGGQSPFASSQAQRIVADMCVICIPPGAKLALSGFPDPVQKGWGLKDTEEVIFTQTSAKENTHRDAVQFRNGSVISLQNIPVGVKATVLSLDGSTKREPVVETTYAGAAR